MLKFGLKKEQIDILVDIFAKYSSISKVIIFGSRVKNTYKEYSDIDLCLYGKIEKSELMEINNQIIESNLLYKTDLIVFEDVTNEKLKQSIDKEGRVFWVKVEI